MTRDDDRPRAPAAHRPTAALVFADGAVIWGQGAGAVGARVGELCFNTAMTGYQEILTDPSYAGQIIAFTFPHIGNVGANPQDVEAITPFALGCVLREPITQPSNHRSVQHFDAWLKSYDLPAITGVDTRALTRRIRAGGAPTVVLAHAPDGVFDLPALAEMARAWPGLEGMDLAKDVWQRQTSTWEQGLWSLQGGFSTPDMAGRPHCVAVDYGAKRNILRNLVSAGFRVTVVPGDTSAADILALAPDAIFLSNGPGDPAATGTYAIPIIQTLLQTGKPIFGICLGHQLLGLAAGGRTYKMLQGHRGANHPVKELASGKVEITSMNHGFAVDAESLPANVKPTHVSLFDGTLCGLAWTDRPVFAVQHHPEASPGPQDSFYLFRRFRELVA